MSLLVGALQVYTPEFVKKRALAQLFSYTAAAFEAEVPPSAGLDYRQCLAQYARFAQTHAEERLHDGREVETVKERLYRNAVELGCVQSKWVRPRTLADVMAVARVLYHMIDIDLQGDERGEVVIRRCYFSQFYSAKVCRLMSAMDAGLLAGLSNGGELIFTGRITEGQPCCRAHLSWENAR